MSMGVSGLQYNRITTAGWCENPHEKPDWMPRAGDAGEWLAFVGVVGNPIRGGAAELFIGGIAASPSVNSAPVVTYLNHAFEATLILGFRSGVVRGVLNGRMGMGVPDPKVRLQVIEFAPYGREPLPFKIPVGWHVDLAMPGDKSATTYLNLPLTWL